MQTLSQLLSGQLAGATKLKLSCGLTEVPEAVFGLAETLEILDLSGNEISSLPVHFGLLKKLKIAFFSDNRFTEFPAVLADCPELDIIGFKANQIASIPETALAAHLRWLILTNNCLETLPASIGKCTRLQKCMLAGNRLKALPPEMAGCTSLELLRIAANQLAVLPEWLYQLPRLSWLAVAGNPCCVVRESDSSLAEINWQELQVTEQLGEGASGFVSKALWQNSTLKGAVQEVAVKIFKGEVTSDGLPGEEMKVSMATGRHPHLVQVLGKLSGHPAQKQGLVFDLIPPACRNLGNPPSFVTCTRDTFPEGTSFPVASIIAIARAIAGAAAHLHANSIMHGDLYCHNILTDEAGDVLLVDYGAASFYHAAHPAAAAAFERLEVRAFGCLLDDLLQHTVPVYRNHKTIIALNQIRDTCMAGDVLQRPTFSMLTRQIDNLER
jgi:predicted Ser/Thr protein kinase